MGQVFKMELQRAFLGIPFFVVLGIGTTISLLYIVQQVLPWLPVDVHSGKPPLTPFVKWIGVTESFGNNVLFLLLPLLASIPYSDSYAQDVHSGFLKNICTRVDKGKYVISKCVAVFLAGGTAFVVPYLINLMAVSLLLPSVLPNPATGTAPIIDKEMWVSLYYSHPYLYIFAYVCIDFLFAGAFALVSLAASVFVKKRFVVILSSFLVYLFLFFALPLGGKPAYAPFFFLKPVQTVTGISFTVIAVEFMIIMMVSVSIFCMGAWRSETY